MFFGFLIAINFIHLTDFKNALCDLLTQLFSKYRSNSMLLFWVCLLFLEQKNYKYVNIDCQDFAVASLLSVQNSHF